MFEPIVTWMPIKQGESGKEGILVIEVPHSVTEVWAAITKPMNLPQWLAPGVIDLRPGGPV